MQISALRFVRIAKINNKRTAHTGENVELGKHSSIVGVTENLYSHYGNQCSSFFKIGECMYLMIQLYHLNIPWAFEQKMLHFTTGILVQPCLLLPYS